MNKLESIAKRIAEIHDEIESLESQREVNLQYCHGSENKHFNDQINKEPYGNCLTASYQWSKEEREEYPYWGEYSTFYDTLVENGCKNCIGAYEAKRAIGKLKQERGRLVGNITKIGQRFISD